MIALLLQTTVPTGLPSEFGQPLLIAFGAAVAIAYHRVQEARIKREQDLNDKLTATFPELLNLMREEKEARRERTNAHRT